MHQIFFIQEILLEIFGHCFSTSAHLAAFARTCQTFKEPALDVLWEDLSNLTPLVRCLPKVCCELDSCCYSFSRSLNKAEWNILQGYTRRVWHIRRARRLRGIDCIGDDAMRVLASFPDPLFPNLRTFDSFYQNRTLLPVVCPAVRSLTSFHLSDVQHSPEDIPSLTKFVETIGECCPNMTQSGILDFYGLDVLPSGPFGASISRQLHRWTHLQGINCRRITLNMATVLGLPSMSTLTLLSFTLNADMDNQITDLGSASVFPNLVDLKISSASLRSITNFFSCIQLLKIEGLSVEVSRYTLRREVRECWRTAQEACPFNTLTRLEFRGSDNGVNDLPEEAWFTSGDLLPYKGFGNLSKIDIEVGWSRVSLTDEDILDLASALPQLEELVINESFRQGYHGVYDGGGITLGGLVQLLRQCPSLHKITLVIDTKTFRKIPHGLDVSFPPREAVELDYSDSYFEPELERDVVDVLKELELNAWSLRF